MGLARTMVSLKFIRQKFSRHTLPCRKRSVGVVLGYGKPRLKYVLRHDKKYWEGVLQRFSGSPTPGAPDGLECVGDLTSEAMTQASVRWNDVLAATFGPVHANKVAKRQMKLQVRLRGKQPVSLGTLAGWRRPYLWLHFRRINAMWLIAEHQARGTCAINWDMSFGQLQAFVTDQPEALAIVGLTPNVGCVSRLCQQDPMQVLCMVDLMEPLLRAGQEHLLSALTSSANHAQLLEMIADHRSKYNMPQTPLQLARSFLRDSVQTSKSHQIKSVVPAANHILGCSSSSGASMTQVASEDFTPQGASGVCKPRRVKQKMVEIAEPTALDTGKWYSIKSAAKEEHECKCAGNCRSGCPGRARACPNNATNNVDYIGPKRWIPLCVACCCKHPSCPAGARRPWGKRLKDANYGFCQSHWT